MLPSRILLAACLSCFLLLVSSPMLWAEGQNPGDGPVQVEIDLDGDSLNAVTSFQRPPRRSDDEDRAEMDAPGLVVFRNRGWHEDGRTLEVPKEDYQLEGIRDIDPDLLRVVLEFKGAPGKVSLQWPTAGFHVYQSDLTRMDAGKNYFWKEGKYTLLVEGLEKGEGTLRATFTPNEHNIQPVHDQILITVVDPRIVPDYNRDRSIDGADADLWELAKLQRWWINNDQDRYVDAPNEGLEDLPRMGSDVNWADLKMNFTADAVDFFPVWLDLNKTLIALPPEKGYSYYLGQDDQALRFAYTGQDHGDPYQYLLRNAAVCGIQFNKRPSDGPEVLACDNKGVQLAAPFLARIAGTETQGVVLAEGAGQALSQSPLWLEIRYGDAVLGRRELPVSISPVRDMYRWLNLREVQKDFRARATNVANPVNRPDDECNDRHLVWVHGYAMPPDETEAWGAEAFKRFYQSGSRAKFTTVTWFGDQGGRIFGNSPDYWRNVESAFNTAQELARQVNNLPGQKVLLAHSLGNVLVSSAIMDHHLMVAKYLMLNPAVAREAFRPEDRDDQDMEKMVHERWVRPGEAYAERLWCSNWYQLFDAGDERSRLAWRGRFQGLAQAVAYYSPSEDVLRKSNGKLPFLLDRVRCFVNQELRKGDWTVELVTAHSQAGWDFNDDAYPDPNPRLPKEGRGLLPPEQANVLPDEQLRVEPFFEPFLNPAVLGPLGDQEASAAAKASRANILAGGVPALSNALGGSDFHEQVTGITVKSYLDFQAVPESVKPWPRDRDDDKTLESKFMDSPWYHSDFMVVAYPWNYKLYDDLVSEGGLQQ